MRTNRGMLNAQVNQQDEFWTKYETIEKELVYYDEFLKDKVVYCNCDHPDKSNFWKYLKEHFSDLNLKQLICTFYGDDAFKTTAFVDDNSQLVEIREPLTGDGDYRSEECLEILKNCDVVITNPPFSLTKFFVPLMYAYHKDFIILGNQNIMTFKDVYPHILNENLRLGVSIHSGDVEFEIPEEYLLIGNAKMEDNRKYAKVTGIRWFTSFNHGRYADSMKLRSKAWNLKNNRSLMKTFWTKYGVKSYPKYDNYPAIEVPCTAAIPSDYDGVVGVPITFLDKYNPKQFKLVGFRKGIDGKDLHVGGVAPYFRFLVQKV